jgi:hypothetical protein
VNGDGIMKIYSWMTTVAALVSLGACQGSPGGSAADEAALASNAASEVPIRKAGTESGLPSDAPLSPTLQSKTTPPAIKIMSSEGAGEFKHTKEGEVPLCWQDYCPCDHPVTALDRTICRNARAGVAMSDEQWSIGAEARDLKYAGDESNRQMDEVISDMKAHPIYDRGD